MRYLPRVIDAELDARLAAAGAVVIEGPKASGKTETARQRVAGTPSSSSTPVLAPLVL